MKKITKEQRDKKIKHAIVKGVEQGVFSGASLAVYYGLQAEKDRELIVHCGRTQYGEKGRKIDNTTLFDLASLTKPLSTTLLCFYCLEKGLLSLDDSIEQYFNLKQQEFKAIRICHLLSHSSGLPSYRPYYKNFIPKKGMQQTEQIVAWILEEKPINPPGKTACYSDLGFILLGRIIEKVTGQKLDSLFEKIIRIPLLPEEELFYRRLPLNDETFSVDIFAATEKCQWRGRVMQAEVHDEHCWAMGGVAGHAGIFGTISACFKLCKIILNSWLGNEKFPFCSTAFLQEALQRVRNEESWCLGFDTPSPGSSSSGQYFSNQSVGHLGYTGTSFWIDSVRELVVVLLTNRVHPNRENKKIQQFRPWIHDQIMEHFGIVDLD